MATKSFYSVLVPLLVIALALTAAMTIFNAITEKNKKAQEEENKAMTRANELAQERIQKQKEERKTLQDAMSTWQ